ncbi:hypothetical protein FOPG_20079 [Fusarium oxysporum f. sp. conglutinans race 2 54008]|uniref:Uncharacterized protein n=1 Tax=Fusarium oxysporum f. sp. conglutinans race 2 54008 TaxID=1089457 RepID=X0GK10_FUSOX|nr:hypothetical protein FOPG_20079 [Fusarium oxysporum f. sp. conglutinans race 2 54008]
MSDECPMYTKHSNLRSAQSQAAAMASSTTNPVCLSCAFLQYRFQLDRVTDWLKPPGQGYVLDATEG